MLRNCNGCGEEYEAERSTSKYCSDTCRYHNHLANKKRITIPRDLRFSVLMRDGYACRYCGARPPQKELRVDHIISVKDGGPLTAMDNLVTACDPCNSGKGDRTLDPASIPPPPDDV